MTHATKQRLGELVPNSGVHVAYHNHTLSVELHFPVKNSRTRVCPSCKLWKKRVVKMVQRADIQGRRWWYCKSNEFTGEWSQCGTMYPVGIRSNDSGLRAMFVSRIEFLRRVTKQDK